MYIESLTLEGFKSYAQRVTVEHFDRQFNAITGLNGSGKSNILDAICFVMGIKNLSQVRAGTMQDLVYKQGQAGISKATVSLTLNNGDPKDSPPGYEDKQKLTITRQIVIGGRDKYLINGVNAQPSRVQDLFHSVKLNVNNPHFLVMQGRITKVLNSKPAEILGLLEEATGTKMYDKKRDVALNTLRKKESRLEDINRMMDNEILPALERLRLEKNQYLQYQQAKEDARQMGKHVHAYRYWKLLRAQSDRAGVGEGLNCQASDLDQQQQRLEADLAAKEDELAALRTQADLQQKGEAEELGKAADRAGIALAKQQATADAAQEDAQASQTEIMRLEAALKDVSEDAVVTASMAVTEALASSRAALENASANAEAAKAELEGIECGDGRDGSNRSMQERLQDAQAEMVQQDADAAQAAVALRHIEDELAAARAAAADKAADSVAAQGDVDAARAAIATAEAALAELPFDTAVAHDLDNRVDAERASVKHWTAKRSALVAGIEHILSFDFRNPRPGFNRAAVRGVLARLVRIRDTAHATALEVAAGAKLNHIVVESEEVGRDLLKGGQLKRRVTIVPLTSTRVNVVAPNKATRAHGDTGGRAKLALELVGFEPDVRRAMEYAFGAAFVCEDMQAAQKVAFSPDIRVRGITLAGDDCNPAGTLTGGSRAKNVCVLARIAELAAVEEELRQHLAALAVAEAEVSKLNGLRQEQAKHVEARELGRHALQLAEGRLASTAGAVAAAYAEQLACQAEQASKNVSLSAERKAALQGQIQELKAMIRDFGCNHGTLASKAKAKVVAAQAALSAAAAVHAQAEDAVHAHSAVAEQASEERKDLRIQIRACKVSLGKCQAEMEAAQGQAAKLAKELASAEEALERHKAAQERASMGVRELTRAKGDLQAALAKLAQTRKRLDAHRARFEVEVQEAAREVSLYEEKHSWLKGARGDLGVEGGEYDFGAQNMREKERAYCKAVETEEQLGRGMSSNVLTAHSRCEEDCKSLTERQQIVLKDRETIQNVIAELDEKKEQALRTAWVKVSEDFNRVFQKLLPGTEAELCAQEDQSFMAGLEVRVAFGGVWKASLSELSGGQRSLLALSLIFALLRFQPAPFYILDEVDAALDLSHTQNIGRMIREYFPNAQFVIVSLKEGMFDNANVLFRTRFVDGTSTVRRICNVPGSSAAARALARPAKRGRTSASAGEQENAAAA